MTVGLTDPEIERREEREVGRNLGDFAAQLLLGLLSQNDDRRRQAAEPRIRPQASAERCSRHGSYREHRERDYMVVTINE